MTSYEQTFTLKTSTPFALHHILWFMILSWTYACLKTMLQPKTKNEVTLKMACRPALKHKQEAGRNTDESDRADRPNRISHVCVHSPQTAVPLKRHHSVQDIWSPAQMRRHSSAEVMFVPTPLSKAKERQRLRLRRPTDYQSFYQMWLFLIHFVSLTD